jgi:hypothetical protein
MVLVSLNGPIKIKQVGRLNQCKGTKPPLKVSGVGHLFFSCFVSGSCCFSCSRSRPASSLSMRFFGFIIRFWYPVLLLLPVPCCCSVVAGWMPRSRLHCVHRSGARPSLAGAAVPAGGPCSSFLPPVLLWQCFMVTHSQGRVPTVLKQ